MASKGFLRSLTGGSNTGSQRDYGSVDVVTASDTKRRVEVLDDFEKAGIGWLWATDNEGHLIYISESAA